MIETARKEDLLLDSKLIIPENRLDAIRIMARLHPVVGDQPTNEKDQPNTNNPVLDLACTILNIHEKGIGVHADLRPIQNEPPSYFYGKGFMSGISNLKGNGILAVYGHWRDGSGRYAIKQFYYTDKEILWRNAVSDTAWSAWFDVLTGNSDLDYNKLLNVPLTSTLSDDKTKIASIFAVNNVNRAAVNAQKTANTAHALAQSKQDKLTFVGDGPDVMKTGAFGLGNTIVIQRNSDLNNYIQNGFYAVAYARDADTIENLPDKIKTKCSIFIYNSDSNKNVNDCTQIATHYKSTLTAIRTYYAHNNRWTDWHYIYNTENTTTDPAGFLRSFGNAVALTTDNLTSDLKVNRSDLVASAKYAYDVYQAALAADGKAVKAQQDATKGINDAAAADKKAANAQDRADAAFSRVKPISEGGTGATTAAQGRKNLGHGDASTRNVATSLNSNGNTLVPLNMLFGYEQKWVDVTKDRLIKTPYKNNTLQTIFISIDLDNSTNYFGILVDGVKVALNGHYGSYFPVPPGSIYEVEQGRIEHWAEFRKI